jgi:hypothetical protein
MSYYSDQNPYQPSYGQPPLAKFEPGLGYPPPTPGVWYFYVAYCLFMALLYLAVVGLGLLFIVAAEPIAAEDSRHSAAEMIVVGAVLCIMGGVLLLMYAVAPLLPKSKAAWIYGFVTIGIGMTSACTLPFCIPLLIFWLKPETKAFFRAN